MIPTLVIQNLTDSTLVHGFVTADCGRGTIDILWSCLTAIFLSIWTVIHLPVPCFDIDRPDNFRRKVVRSRVGPSVITLLAPEFMLCFALGDCFSGYATKKKLEKLSIDAKLALGFSLEMGGVCLRAPTGRYHQLRIQDIEKAIAASNTTAGMKDAANASDTPAGLKDDITASDTVVRIEKTLSHSKEWVQELKRIKESDIEDLAKSDSVTKFFACFQGLWVLTQAISRIYQHKALSLLEVTTSAYICCAVGIYAFWWKKPQSCSAPIMITCSDEAIEELSSSAYEGQVGNWAEFIWAGRNLTESTDTQPSYSTFSYYCLVGLVVSSLTIFGFVHLASWNSRLPSTIELWMWRGSSLYCAIFAGLCAFNSAWKPSSKTQTLYKALDQSTDYGVYVYAFIRIYMIVEVFISLRALPASAFQSVQWSSFLPHI